MKRLYFITILIVAATICGCNKSGVEVGKSDEMTFSAVYPGSSKATDAGFESGDKIGLYVTHYDGTTAPALEIAGAYASNIGSTFDGTSWTCNPKLYWADGKFDFYGYYPYMNVSSIDSQPFSVALDQNTLETTSALSGYEASDFLWSKVEGTERVDKVNMVFSHKMSKLVVKLVKSVDYEGELPSDAEVRILNVVTDALVDISTGSVVKDPHAAAKTITAKKISNDTYDAIIVPQRLENRVPLVEILANGVSYIVDSRFAFKSGVQHTISITISDNPDQIKIDIGGEIQGW